MPWLLVNLALPLIVLAAKFLGEVVEKIDWRRMWRGWGSAHRPRGTSVRRHPLAPGVLPSLKGEAATWACSPRWRCSSYSRFSATGCTGGSERAASGPSQRRRSRCCCWRSRSGRAGTRRTATGTRPSRCSSTPRRPPTSRASTGRSSAAWTRATVPPLSPSTRRAASAGPGPGYLRGRSGVGYDGYSEPITEAPDASDPAAQRRQPARVRRCLGPASLGPAIWTRRPHPPQVVVPRELPRDDPREACRRSRGPRLLAHGDGLLPLPRAQHIPRKLRRGRLRLTRHPHPGAPATLATFGLVVPAESLPRTPDTGREPKGGGVGPAQPATESSFPRRACPVLRYGAGTQRSGVEPAQPATESSFPRRACPVLRYGAGTPEGAGRG